MLDDSPITVPNSDLVYVVITGVVSGARGHVHFPTQRMVAEILGGDDSTSEIVLGDSLDELRAQGFGFIAIERKKKYSHDR